MTDRWPRGAARAPVAGVAPPGRRRTHVTGSRLKPQLGRPPCPRPGSREPLFVVSRDSATLREETGTGRLPGRVLELAEDAWKTPALLPYRERGPRTESPPPRSRAWTPRHPALGSDGTAPGPQAVSGAPCLTRKARLRRCSGPKEPRSCILSGPVPDALRVLE